MPCHTPGSVLVEVDRLVTKVYTPYDPAFVALVKTQVPGRRWSPTGRFWYAPTSATPSLKDVAVAYFGYPVVEVVNCRRERTRKRRERTRKQADARTTTRATWADHLFDGLPARLHQPVHRALVKVVHPDHGGDHEAAVALNTAWQRRQVPA